MAHLLFDGKHSDQCGGEPQSTFGPQLQEDTLTEIKTTHVGSLPRSAEVTEVLFAAERGEPVDSTRFEAVVASGVDDAVARQVSAGVGIISDGEMAKISYATYIKDRITGFDGDSPRRAPADLE